jgi:flagellar FliL protein
MAEETAQAVAVAGRAAKGGLVALAGLVVLAVAVVGAWRLWLPERTAAEATQAEPAVGALLPLDPFIANLADEDGKRYLKATLQVEFFGARVPDDFTARVPQMRDLLLTLLTSKLFAEVRTPEGKAVLRDEIITRMNRALNKDLVKAVYFTEFIVQ